MIALQTIVATLALIWFALAVWAGLRWFDLGAARDEPAAATAALLPAPPEPGMVDLSVLLREVADRMAPLAASRGTRIRVAVSPGRSVWCERNAIADAVGELVSTAVCCAPGGQVLLSALPLGTEMHIVVTDDELHPEQAIRETIARGAEQTIALQGGRVAVEVRPGRGTTVTICIPNEAPAPAPAVIDESGTIELVLPPELTTATA